MVTAQHLATRDSQGGQELELAEVLAPSVLSSLALRWDHWQLAGPGVRATALKYWQLLRAISACQWVTTFCFDTLGFLSPIAFSHPLMSQPPQFLTVLLLLLSRILQPPFLMALLLPPLLFLPRPPPLP